MKIKQGVNIQGLDLKMRPALVHAERIWKQNGRNEGVTVTSALDGTHSAGSLHYYGMALDFRTRYFTRDRTTKVHYELNQALKGVSNHFQVIKEKTHIHVEYDPL